MSTLTELIKESLEGKLTDQIQASLEAEDNGMNEAEQVFIAKLNKKFSEKLFYVPIPESKREEVDQFLKKYFNIGLSELGKLNCAIISDISFRYNYKVNPHKKFIDEYKWYSSSGIDEVHIHIFRHYPDNTLFGSFRAPRSYKKLIIFGTMKELEF